MSTVIVNRWLNYFLLFTLLRCNLLSGWHSWNQQTYDLKDGKKNDFITQKGRPCERFSWLKKSTSKSNGPLMLSNIAISGCKLAQWGSSELVKLRCSLCSEWEVWYCLDMSIQFNCLPSRLSFLSPPGGTRSKYVEYCWSVNSRRSNKSITRVKTQ